MTKLNPLLQTRTLQPSGNRYRTRWLIAALIVGVSAIASLPFFFIAKPLPGKSAWSLRMPATHDMRLHYDQMKSFYEGLRSGLIYPRWEADTNRGYGAPTTSYYPPGVYYVTAAMYRLSGDWTWALVWAHWLMMGLSGWAMYVYARGALGRWAAVVAMAAYVVGPYHLLDEYQRGAIAELLGFIWMPLMLWSGERLLKARAGSDRATRGRGDRATRGVSETVNEAGRVSEAKPVVLSASEAGEASRDEASRDEASKREASKWKASEWRREAWAVSVLALSYGAFVWSHPPTAYQFSLGFGVYVVVLGVLRREWLGIVKVGAGLGLGIGLAAAYILPAAVEQHLINSSNIAETYPYHDSYLLARLSTNAGTHDYFLAMLDRFWILTAILLILTVAVLFVFGRRILRRDPAFTMRVRLWFVLGCFMCFMMTVASYPLGRLIPKIDIGVFSWRMFSVTTLAVSLLVGACAEACMRLTKRHRKPEALLAGVMVVWALVGSAWFSYEEVIKPYSNGDPFQPEPEHVNYPLTPSAANGDLLRLPKVEPAVLAQGKGQVNVAQWSPQHRLVRVALDAPDRLLLRTFDFPGWTVTVDGQRAAIIKGRGLRVQTADGEETIISKLDYSGWTPTVDGKPALPLNDEPFGDIQVDLEAGAHEVRLDYLPTPIRRASNLVTLAAMGLLAGLLLAPIAWRRGKRRAR